MTGSYFMKYQCSFAATEVVWPETLMWNWCSREIFFLRYGLVCQNITTMFMSDSLGMFAPARNLSEMKLLGISQLWCSRKVSKGSHLPRADNPTPGHAFKTAWFYLQHISEVLSQKLLSKAGISNDMRQILCCVIICPYPRYMFLTQLTLYIITNISLWNM